MCGEDGEGEGDLCVVALMSQSLSPLFFHDKDICIHECYDL